MENLLVKLMLVAALAQLGLSPSTLYDPMSKQNHGKLEQGSKDILRINWKPISIFPEEAKRFQ